ncbi:hypothetical protein [Pseudomonas kuykendallii]|uniref:hypothetical protein n=1 Tax=Pseudomonas kuykendallii TaxID=1007099 RepID=UPI0036F282F9
MDIFEIRKANLVRLIGSRRKGACAEKWEMAPAHLSQVLSTKTAKNLGEDVARRIEEKESLPYGWLDTLQVERIPEQSGRSLGEQPASYGAAPEPQDAGSSGRGYRDDRYKSAPPSQRQAVDDLADKMLALTPEQAIKLKQAMDLLMPSNDRPKD